MVQLKGLHCIRIPHFQHSFGSFGQPRDINASLNLHQTMCVLHLASSPCSHEVIKSRRTQSRRNFGKTVKFSPLPFYFRRLAVRLTCANQMIIRRRPNSDFKAIYQNLSALASTVVDSVLPLVLVAAIAPVLFHDPSICSLSHCQL